MFRELLWLLFVPITLCQLTFLPVVTAQSSSDEHAADAALQVMSIADCSAPWCDVDAVWRAQAQQAIARELQVSALSYTKKDALRLRKCLLASPELRHRAVTGSLTDSMLHELHAD